MSEWLHSPRRPGWKCLEGCGDWPCDQARKMMFEVERQQPDEIRMHLGRVMAIAADELLVPNPAELYPRFLRWIEPRGIVCRACAKKGHDILPGLPPRLFPCLRRED